MIAALGLGLLASGVKGLKQYWQIIVLLLSLPGSFLQIIEELFKVT